MQGRSQFSFVVRPLSPCSASPHLRPSPKEKSIPGPCRERHLPWRALLKDGSAFLSLESADRAEDAAIVPVTMNVNLPAGDVRRLIALTVVIDRNPSPLVGVFKPGSAVTLVSLSTRVRVDSYTNLHVVAELSDGEFYVTQRFIVGQLSAPMLKQDTQDAKATMGSRMRFRQFPLRPDQAGVAVPPDERDIQVMLGRPTIQGMQMDQLSRLYIPPLFVEDLKVWQGEDLVLCDRGRHRFRKTQISASLIGARAHPIFVWKRATATSISRGHPRTRDRRSEAGPKRGSEAPDLRLRLGAP